MAVETDDVQLQDDEDADEQYLFDRDAEPEALRGIDEGETIIVQDG